MDKIRSFSKDRTNERSRGTERGTGDGQSPVSTPRR